MWHLSVGREGRVREIKFRAWDKEVEEMLFPEWEEGPVGGGNVMELFIYNSTKYPPNHSSLSWILKKSEYFVPMQYTGLKDKNGKEVYAGDVVRYWHYEDRHIDYIVTYDEKRFAWMLKEIGSARTTFLHHFALWLLEIIGNVHEHPDLLKGE